jgi:hypothetical protein
MNNVARTLAVRMRLSDRTLPHGALGRRLGEYSGGGVCAGCGDRITAAQASYEVDLTPDVNSTSVRFHRECLEIWEQESRISSSEESPRSGALPPELVRPVLTGVGVMNITLTEAFSRCGATPASRVHCLSAIAADGAMVLNCLHDHFTHPSRGVLRYEDRLSRQWHLLKLSRDS